MYLISKVSFKKNTHHAVAFLDGLHPIGWYSSGIVTYIYHRDQPFM